MLHEPRRAVLNFDGVDMVFSEQEVIDSREESWLINLQGWFGGVGVDGDKTQRSLGHGYFPSVAQRTGRALTLEGTLWFQTDRDRLVADRFVSGIGWDGSEGTLTVTTGNLTLTSTVRIDGEIGHKYHDPQGTDVQIPLLAADPFLYAEPQAYQVYPLGSGVGIRFPLMTGEGGGTAGVVSFGQANPNTQAVIQNRGNATAYPLIRVHGDWPSGFVLMDDQGRSIEWAHPVWQQAPVEIDNNAGVILQGGREVSWQASQRTWFDIPAYGAGAYRVSSIQPSTDGWVEIIHRDTYL